MPNIKSAKKRVLVTKSRYERNKARRSELKTSLKKSKAEGASTEVIRLTVKKIDKAAAKNLIHKNKAARLKSQLAKKSNASANA